MPSPLPYLPLWHNDYLSSSTVAEMTIVSEAIYLKLLMFQWEDGSVPDNREKLMRRVKVTVDQWQEFDEYLDQCFPLNDDGKRRNPRLQMEREKALAKVELNRANGALGGRPRTKPETKPSTDTPSGSKSQATETERLTQTKPNGYETLNPNRTQNKPISETETETYIGDTPYIPLNGKPPQKKFIAPTIEEVIGYGKEIDLPESECRSFWFYYDSKDWKRGRDKMQKWKSALSGWKSRWESNPHKTRTYDDNWTPMSIAREIFGE